MVWKSGGKSWNSRYNEASDSVPSTRIEVPTEPTFDFSTVFLNLDNGIEIPVPRLTRPCCSDVMEIPATLRDRSKISCKTADQTLLDTTEEPDG